MTDDLLAIKILYRKAPYKLNLFNSWLLMGGGGYLLIAIVPLQWI